MLNKKSCVTSTNLWLTTNSIAISLLALAIIFPYNKTEYKIRIPNSQIYGAQVRQNAIEGRWDGGEDYLLLDINNYISELDYTDMSKEQIVEIIEFQAALSSMLLRQIKDLPLSGEGEGDELLLHLPSSIVDYFQ